MAVNTIDKLQFLSFITDNTLKANDFNCHFASVDVADNDITPDCANVTLCSHLIMLSSTNLKL